MPSEPQLVRFGVFEVGLRTEEIRKAGIRLRLGGQPFQLLQALLERPGELITREELRQRLWPDNTHVDYDLALKKAVNRLRDVLGDSADSPHFIETVPRRGYRFIGTIAAPPSVPSDFAERSIAGAVETAEAHVGGPKSETRKSRKLVGSVVLAGIATVL